ncbi:MAG: hypothetical protein ABSF70_05210 [Terracidiphilus sp.]
MYATPTDLSAQSSARTPLRSAWLLAVLFATLTFLIHLASSL